MKIITCAATTIIVTIACALLFASCGSCGNPDKPINEPNGIGEIDLDATGNGILFSFAFIGCNRIDRSDKHNPNTNGSTANLPELQRTFTEISQLNPKPAFLFFMGDMVIGQDTTNGVLHRQLKEWVKLYHDTAFSPISRSGIKMIALPGNHEMLWSKKIAPKRYEELPWKHAMDIWMQEMGEFMPSQPLNRVGGSDSMDNLQTYSFNYDNTHFIVLNTDTYNDSILEGRLPVDWVITDMQKTRKDTAIKHMFLLGHKPAYVYNSVQGPHNTFANYIVYRLWREMKNNRAEAMLSAHSHMYARYQPNGGSSYQVIAGNGGSPYERSLAPSKQFFGYTLVNVMTNGKVIVKSMGRSVQGSKYLESIPATLPTTRRDSVDISWGTTAPKW